MPRKNLILSLVQGPRFRNKERGFGILVRIFFLKENERNNKHSHWSSWDSGGKFMLGALLPRAWHSTKWHDA